MKKHKKKGRNSGTLILLLILATLTYVHNFADATRTKARDFDYAGWQVLTKSTDLFSSVHSKDVFISLSQNDVYESNAGSFYFNTGIRLAQLFNTVNIWPNYVSCTINSGCLLGNVRKQVLQTLPNFNFGALVTTNRSEQQTSDWVGINSKPGALRASKIWDFDEYPITGSTMIAYLALYDETQKTAAVQLHTLRFVTISKFSAPVLNPVLNGYCLVRQPKAAVKINMSGSLRVTYWNLPKLDQKGNPLPKSLDIRSFAVGTC